MIKITDKFLLKIIKELPKDFKVIDIGGASAPLKRANYVIDIIPFNKINWHQTKDKENEIMFSNKTYIQQDICDRKPWPFADKQFDYCVCSHVLEDIRDPLWVCSEMTRISKAGYIEVPSILYETSFGIEAKNLAGNRHHRWLIDIYEEKLRFTFKQFFVHSKDVNKNRKKFCEIKNDFLKIEWDTSFEYFENWVVETKDFYEFLLNKQLTEKEVWKIYRKIGPKNIFYLWLTYFKNTNKFLNKFYNNFFVKKNII